MTIREQLNKQLLQTRLIAFGAWLAFAMSLFLPNSLPVHGLTGIAFLVFAGCVGIILFRIRCPRCQHPIGREMSTTAKISHCAGCGVSLDERV